MIELVIVSRLLEYPDAALCSINKRCLRRLPRRKICQKRSPCAGHFPARFNDDGSARCPAQYSELFDRGRATSLLLFEQFTVNPVTAARRWWICWRSTTARLAVKQPRIARPSAAVSGYLAQLPQSEAVEGLKDIAPIWHC